MGNVSVNFITTIATGALIGAAAGYLGSLMIIRKMALVGDALSHVALPGLAIALILKINPLIGAFVFLALAVAGIWILDQKTEAGAETLVGIFFTASLALGILLTDELELLEALFGDISKITQLDAILGIILSLLAITITKAISKRALLGTISKDLAKSAGIDTAKIDFMFLFLVAIIVALGIKVTGTLLTGALVIIPAAAAKNISRSFGAFSKLSLLFGGLFSILGILLSYALSYPPGPVVVLVGTAAFLATLFFRKD